MVRYNFTILKLMTTKLCLYYQSFHAADVMSYCYFAQVNVTPMQYACILLDQLVSAREFTSAV
jgi:hypothetical protein